MQDDTQVFRPGMLEALWMTLVSYTLVFVVCFPLSALLARASLFLFIYAVTSPFFIIGTATLAVWLSKTLVNSAGIRGYNAIGVFRTVSWCEMKHVSRINLLGLKYLRVHTNNSKWVLWLPLFHIQQQELEQMVLTHAPIENVLRGHFPSKPLKNIK